MINVLESVIYWLIVLLPFSVAISPGLSNTFIGFLVFAFFLKKIIKRQRLFISTALNLPFLLFIVVALLSIKNSLYYAESLHGITKLLKGGLVFLICAEEIRDAEHIRKIVLSIICGICLVSIDGLWQLKFGWDFIRGNAVQSSPIHLARPTAAFPNPNVMGIYLSLTAPLVMGLALYYYTGKKKVAWGIASLLAAVGVYITLSRGSGLGLFFALFFLALMRRHKLLIGVLLAVLLIYPFVMPKNIKDWARSANYNPLVFLFNQDRISMYMNSMHMISQHPFIGVGVNTFCRNYSKFKTEKAEAYCHTQDTSYAQSNFFQMAGETGLMGLGIFFWLLWLLFRGLMRYYRLASDSYLKVISISLAASLLAFLINGLTESSLYYSRVAVMFWYLVGFSLALNKFLKTDG